MTTDKKTRPGPRPSTRSSAATPKRSRPKVVVATPVPAGTDASPVDVDLAHAQRAVARSVFGNVLEVHRPRLVLFVGTPASSSAAVAALWFGALAAESKATIVLAYTDDPPPLTAEVMTALAENGLDPRRLIPRTLTPELLAAADLVVTLSSGRQARAKLPKTTRRREHWTIPSRVSPKMKVTAARVRGAGAPVRRASEGAADQGALQDALIEARALRDFLRARVAMLVFSEGWGRPEISREDARVTRAKLQPAIVDVRARSVGAFRHGRSEEPASSFLPEAPSVPTWFAGASLGRPSLR